MSCSRSISIHLLRGLGAVAMIALAVIYGSDRVWLLAPLLIGAVVLMRGCPMCWLTGLLATISASRGNDAASARHQDRSRPW